MTKKIVKPLFKYIGGKSWLRNELSIELNKILAFNPKLDTYVEPFAGGLGAFLGIYETLIQYNVKNVILADINLGLINLYGHIYKEKDALIENTISIERNFLNFIPDNIKNINDKIEIKNLLRGAEQFFKEIRKDFNHHKNENTIIQSSRLIFLQKHSFNGVYRENSRGEYNTPFNWSGSSMLGTIENRVNELFDVFNLFNIQFITDSYQKIDYSINSVYYLDPPYINEQIIENKYNKDSFDLKEQLSLIEAIKNLNFIYSNHYSEILIKELKNNPNIDIKKIARKNIMSSNAETRKTDKFEMLATNLNH